ncbi:hypothetical protein BGX34_004143 [Mortierella sp. NVP85]|nr:hypothetical protein BGX34_004143 [Mortierella sp. NVP85]
MDAVAPQEFRSQSSSKVVAIPTRQDPKSGQRVVRWKDIQQCFKDAQYVMNSGLAVMFLTDDELEDLVPLRIAHHPGVTLQVIDADDNRGDSSSTEAPTSNNLLVSEPSVDPRSSGEMVFVSQDVSPLSIRGTDNSHALVVSSQCRPSDGVLQMLPMAGTSHYQPEAEGSRSQQEQLYQLQQQMQQVHHHMEDLLVKIQQISQQAQDTQQQVQHTQSTQQQMKDGIDTALQQTQHYVLQLEQRFRETQQTILQHEMHEMEKPSQQRTNLSLEAFEQFLHAQHRVQAILTKSSSALSTPRLLIILPEPTGVVDGQERLCALQFRLHFLCECAAHPIPRDYNNPHQVHLTNHPGYQLHNLNEFIDKYGSYLLAMMYMIKYGARVGGFVVPPLLGLTHAIQDNAEEHLLFISKNIKRLVDDTITYLQEAVSGIGSDISTHQNLDLTDLTNLRSHLKVKDDECILGGLGWMEIQDAHYTSICSHHLCDCYESALEQLIHGANGRGDEWNGAKVKVVATPEAIGMLFNDESRKLLRIQSMKIWPFLTEIDLNLNGHHSASSLTTETFGHLNGLESISLNFGRLRMSARGISQGSVRDMSIEIKSPSELTSDDLEFIHQCRPNILAISEKLQERDDNHLVGIIQHNPSIIDLRIECSTSRYIAVIDLVKSTREVMDASCNLELGHMDNKVRVSFVQGSSVFDIESHIKLVKRGCHPTHGATRSFLHDYGWSAKTYVLDGTANGLVVKQMSMSTYEKGSRITHLDFAPTNMSAHELDAMDRIIDRSQGLVCLRLRLRIFCSEDQRQRALIMLERHKKRLTSLHLTNIYQDWLPQVMRAVTARTAFPLLEEFFVEAGLWNNSHNDDAREWIISMVSARPLLQTTLKRFELETSFEPHNWRAVIKALDLSKLEELYLNAFDFSRELLKFLADAVASSIAPLPMRILRFRGGRLKHDADVRALFARIREKAPQVNISVRAEGLKMTDN